MNSKKNTNKKSRIIFSETAGSVVTGILEKYGLKSTQKKMLNEMNLARTFSEKEKIFEALPGRQIAKLVKRAAEEKISLENLASELQKQLNISSENAKNIALELQKKVLVFARKIPIETEQRTSAAKKGIKPTTMVKPPPKEFAERPKRIQPRIQPRPMPKPEIEKKIPKKIEKQPKKQDTYREPLE